jgi:hypothetical protein
MLSTTNSASHLLRYVREQEKTGQGVMGKVLST